MADAFAAMMSSRKKPKPQKLKKKQRSGFGSVQTVPVRASSGSDGLANEEVRALFYLHALLPSCPCVHDAWCSK
jgi:hypothetical protein